VQIYVHTSNLQNSAKKACGSRLELVRSGTLLVYQDVGFLNVFNSGSGFKDIGFFLVFRIWICCVADIKLFTRPEKKRFLSVCF
jgi:hypothetical protein